MTSLAAEKLKYFLSINLFTIYISQIRLFLENFSYMNLLDSNERETMRLINKPALPPNIPTLGYRSAVEEDMYLL